jgi:hypothetical protein
LSRLAKSTMKPICSSMRTRKYCPGCPMSAERRAP